ncbi:5458_t:CDS:2, partial [Paraglomus occultum]
MESKRAFAIGTDAERLPTANPGGADVEVTEHTGCFEDALSQTVVNETKSKDYDWDHNVEEVGDKFSHAEIIRQDVERGVVRVDNDYEDASCHDPALLLLDNLPK